ncbi:hypothetical protein Rhopal_007714-T1 [Rhodotorula paludigena]|uniref:Proteophosphoglycan ppg4 n=1 Tax=Rhodotorula paludigena TaxID=86838 RepID=A0AAV5GYP0_9BASI|nr:hypothetical protein Rhopal_007714-T1 [Rhodotorula paludigena]
MSSADELLSILRGTRPAPSLPDGAGAPPPPGHGGAAGGSAPPARAPSASSLSPSLYQTAPHTPAPAPAAPDLVRLFSGNPPHSSPAASQPPPGAQQTAQQSFLDLSSATPQPASPPVPSRGNSASLLSLLHGSSVAPRAAHSQSQPAPAETTKGTTPGERGQFSPASPPGGTARELLGLLMGAGTPAKSPGPSNAPRSGAGGGAQNGLHEGDAPSTASVASNGAAPSPPSISDDSKPVPTTKGPNFSFASPFEALEKLRQDERRASPVAARSPLSSVPAHIRTPSTARPALSVTSSSDTSEPGSPSLLQTLNAPVALAQVASGPTSPTPLPTSYLAAQYLSPSPSAAPSWAPSGVRLPRSAHPPDAPQHLSILLTEPHLDSLAPTLPQVTPITLLSIPPAFLGARRTAAIWERGIVYATGAKGRVRVIDRESGATVLLKGGKKDGEVRDVQVAPYATKEGRRSIACVNGAGAVAVWEVQDGFASEGEASPIRTFGLPPAAGDTFSLVRFSPNADSNLLAAVQRRGVVLFQPTDAGRRSELNFEGDIADVAFSHDGTAFIVLSSDGQYSVYATDDLALSLSGDVPSLPVGATADEIAFLSPADVESPCAAIAVSSRSGTHITLLPLAREVSVEQLKPAVVDFTAASAVDGLWGQVAYHRESQSLVVSNSLRGSLYAFRLTFAPPPTSPSYTTDAAHLRLLASAPLNGTRPTLLRVDHVLEHPTPSPILSFSLDSLPSAEASATTAESALPAGVRAASKLQYGALVVHPGGVHHVALAAERPRVYTPAAERDRAAGIAFGFGTAASGGGQPVPDLSEIDEDEDDGDGDAKDAFAAALAAGRRMSLEGSIYVSSEVEVVVDEPETDEISLRVASSLADFRFDSSPAPLAPVLPHVDSVVLGNAQPSIDEPPLGDLSNGLGGALTPVALASPGVTPSTLSASEGIKLAGPVVNAAIRSMKASKAAAASSATGAASPALSTAAVKGGSSPPASVGGGIETGLDGLQSSDSALLKELRRIEAVLPGKIGKAVSRELEKHTASHADPTSSAGAAAAHDEALVALVQQSLAKDIERAVQSGVQQHMSSQVAQTVEQAVRKEMGRGVEEAIRQILPREMEQQLSQPRIAFSLSHSIATTIAPPLERSLTTALVKSVVPLVDKQIGAAVEGVIKNIRQEMVDVRKEIVQEQSGSVAILEDEVANLREEVSTLKAMVEKMHSLLLATPRTPPAITSPRALQQPPATVPQQTRPPAQRHVSQPLSLSTRAPPRGPLLPASPLHPLRREYAPSSGNPHEPTPSSYALPPIPRAPTPPERYEELFTEAMQPRHEPEFTALVHLIHSSPLSRLDAVFPAPPAPPKITMAVVLSLAFRLSQVIAGKETPLDDEGKKQLLWLRKAIAACDGKQPPELLALIPRILTNVIENLVLRGRSLMALHDQAGAGEVRLVQQYAHARLSLFVQSGPEGPGVEAFRR